VKFDFLDDYL